MGVLAERPLRSMVATVLPLSTGCEGFSAILVGTIPPHRGVPQKGTRNVCNSLMYIEKVELASWGALLEAKKLLASPNSLVDGVD